MNWYLDGLKNYTGFSGRAHRTEFWMYVLFTVIVVVVLSIIEGIVGLTGILTTLYYLGTLLPNIAVSMRRLHDTDRSGWWLLIGFIPFIGAIVLLIFYCLDGTPGSNRFGADPKGGASMSAG
ncbi:MAG: DUF805 domain-containing protein [Candidatus Hydrogenedentes bacterium]|nr:DUF805 domain-containing protein [Candidatus Hydrogenedentota bacterium]